MSRFWPRPARPERADSAATHSKLLRKKDSLAALLGAGGQGLQLRGVGQVRAEALLAALAIACRLAGTCPTGSL